jgi:putative membrane protein
MRRCLDMLMHWAGGWWEPWFLVFPLFWFAVVFGAIFLLRHRGPAWRRTSSPEEILAERYARGEISVEEYRQRLGVLQSRER